MQQIAVFVDAGYLYAQGSVLLHGKRLPRDHVSVQEEQVLHSLREWACKHTPDARLLRVYWYDGVRNGQPSLSQESIGKSDNTKLRLGLVNSQGEQKEVDPLIVTDLIDLARNGAITDALILTGDGDIKIGVRIARTFGVRVHLLGVESSSSSQSKALRMEADTCHEWDKDTVRQVLRCEPQSGSVVNADWSTDSNQDNSGHRDGFSGSAAAEISECIRSLGGAEIDRHHEYMEANHGHIHPDIDRPTLARLRRRLDRDLTDKERKSYRKMFRRDISQARGSEE